MQNADIARLLMSEDPEAVMTAIQILRRRDRLAAGAAGGTVSGVLEQSGREKK